MDKKDEQIALLTASLRGMIKLARTEEFYGSLTWGKAADLAEGILNRISSSESKQKKESSK